MKLDVVMITTMSRPQLLMQSLSSLVNNAEDPLTFNLIVVCDGEGAGLVKVFDDSDVLPNHLIINYPSQGASASRNIAASSIPKYRRGSHVLFLDDDVYMCPKWDEKLMELAAHEPKSILSGYSHPYNHYEPQGLYVAAMYGPDRDFSKLEKPGRQFQFGKPLVISSVAMMMSWSLWDDVGFWTEPGGVGASEDFDYCMRAKAKGYGFAVTEPQCVLHTGLTSSNGNKIVGYQESVELNQKLVREYGLKAVVFQ